MYGSVTTDSADTTDTTVTTVNNDTSESTETTVTTVTTDTAPFLLEASTYIEVSLLTHEAVKIVSSPSTGVLWPLGVIAVTDLRKAGAMGALAFHLFTESA